MLEGGGGAEAKRRSSLDMSGIVEDRYTEAASIGLYERMDAVFEGMDFDGNGTIEKDIPLHLRHLACGDRMAGLPSC